MGDVQFARLNSLLAAANTLVMRRYFAAFGGCNTRRILFSGDRSCHLMMFMKHLKYLIILQKISSYQMNLSRRFKLKVIFLLHRIWANNARCRYSGVMLAFKQ